MSVGKGAVGYGLNVIFIFIFMFMFVQDVSAAALYCAGSVSNLVSRNNGEVLFKAGFRNDYIAVCSLQASRDGVSIDQCKSWYATLLAAQMSGTPVSLHYQNSQNYSSCSVVPIYSDAPSPNYVMIGDVSY